MVQTKDNQERRSYEVAKYPGNEVGRQLLLRNGAEAGDGSGHRYAKPHPNAYRRENR